MSFEQTVLSRLRHHIAVEREKAAGLLSAGAISDFSEYRYSVGYIKSLDDVIMLMDQITTDIQKG